MCGICGIVSFTDKDIDENLLGRMGSLLHHRGPDENGIYNKGRVGLSHYRLSIIDLSGGHQPMGNEDGSLWITYNGEIYNHLELRRELQQKGHKYATKSDTETILHAYEEYGPDVVNRLRGMFAFAIWDEKKSRLFCARDRFGIKPFYYYESNEKFVFASEIKAVLEDDSIQREMNIDSLPEYLFFGYPTQGRSMFENVSVLPPGHTLTINGSKTELHQYWDVPEHVSDESLPQEHYENELERLLSESVRMHLMSDVPLGVFLSGGVDSSLIAAMAGRDLNNELNTFSVGYDDKHNSELPYAKIVSEYLNTKHHEITISCRDFAENLPRLIWQEDEPIVFSSSVPLYMVSKLASEHVKVVLSGEGSDEIFAGYPKYAYTMFNSNMMKWYKSLTPEFMRNSLIRPLLDNMPMPLKYKKKLRHTFFFYSPEVEDIYINNFFPGIRPEEQKRVLSSMFNERIAGKDSVKGLIQYFNECPGTDFVSKVLYMDQKSYLLELLMRQDAMSMATSIESRVPFLDHKVVEYGATIPYKMKISGFEGKVILKKIAEKYLPNSIVYRKKMGFPTPMSSWFRNELSSNVSEILLGSRSRSRNMYDYNYIEAMLKKNNDGVIDWTEQIWRLVNLELWIRTFIDRDDNVRF